MKMRWPLTLIVGLGLLAAPVSLIRADEPGMGGDHEAHWKHEGHHDWLELTEDQKTKLKTLGESESKAVKPLWRKQRDLETKLRDQVEDKAGDSELKATLAELKTNGKALKEERERFRKEKEALFTPVQQAKRVLTHERKMREKWEHKREGHDREWGHEREEHHADGDHDEDTQS